MTKHRFDSALIDMGHPDKRNIRQPFRARCVKCGKKIYFDIDPSGTPGFNGDWSDGNGDYSCHVERADSGNSHIPVHIVYDRTLYPSPKG